MAEVQLPGLRGSHPSSFLAALGLLSLARRATQGARLSWALRDGDPIARFTTDDEVDLVRDVIGPALLAGTGVPAWERTGVSTAPAKVKPEAFRQLAKSFDALPVVDPAGELAWLSALGSDLRVASTGAVGASPLFNLSGNQQLKGTVAKLEAKLTRKRRGERQADIDQIVEVLNGRWRYVEGANSLGFDVSGGVSAALDGKAAETSAVPTLAWLAYHALPLFPTFGQSTTAIAHSVAQGASRREPALVWAVWRQPLGVNAVKVLVSDAGLQMLATTSPDDSKRESAWERLDRMGAWRVYASRRESYGQGYGRFHIPQEIARADLTGT